MVWSCWYLSIFYLFILAKNKDYVIIERQHQSAYQQSAYMSEAWPPAWETFLFNLKIKCKLFSINDEVSYALYVYPNENLTNALQVVKSLFFHHICLFI